MVHVSRLTVLVYAGGFFSHRYDLHHKFLTVIIQFSVIVVEREFTVIFNSVSGLFFVILLKIVLILFHSFIDDES